MISDKKNRWWSSLTSRIAYWRRKPVTHTVFEGTFKNQCTSSLQLHYISTTFVNYNRDVSLKTSLEELRQFKVLVLVLILVVLVLDWLVLVTLVLRSSLIQNHGLLAVNKTIVLQVQAHAKSVTDWWHVTDRLLDTTSTIMTSTVCARIFSFLKWRLTMLCTRYKYKPNKRMVSLQRTELVHFCLCWYFSFFWAMKDDSLLCLVKKQCSLILIVQNWPLLYTLPLDFLYPRPC